MKKFTAILLLLTLTILAGGTTKRALLVIIGDYPSGSGWNSLASHNDKAILLKMLDRNGFHPEDIVCLEDADATYSGIIEALRLLKEQARPGDQIYIHFSCHGQQITDIDGDEVLRDFNDHYDEAIVPYDAAIAYNWNGYKGEHHLTDDVLSQHMSAIQDALGKNGRLLLVVDACHSGGVQRAKCEDKAPHRGTYDCFKLPLTGRPLSPNSVTETWITISACKSFQTNYEVEVDGIRYGRLTYTISQVLCAGINAEKLEKEIKRVYKSLPMPARKHQTPELSAPSSLMHKTIFK